MITNILIAISYFGVGFFVGMFTAAAITLSAYKKNSKETVLVLEEYAEKW